MLIVLFVICLGLIFCGIIAWGKSKRFPEYSDERESREYASIAIVVISSVFLIVVLIMTICHCGELVKGKYINEKIEMYQSENAKIESQVAETVNKYIELETEIIKTASDKVNPDSAITIVAAYPGLNSSGIITKQIEIHAENNQKIKELQEEEINLKPCKWWLYFG